LLTVVQVSGQAIPFTQTVLIPNGAVPLMSATSLLTRIEPLTVKAAGSSAAIWLAILERACPSQVLSPEGLSTLSPSAVKALYFASSQGPLIAGSRGPLTSSLSPRQYMRRKAGQLKMLLVFVS